MHATGWGLTLVTVLIAATAESPRAGTARLSAADTRDNTITLAGCLVRGEAGGYLLTNGASEPAWQKADTSVTPGAVGTTGTVASVFYWLSDNEHLREHVGQRVEIGGQLDDQIADGEIRVDRQAQWTMIEIQTGDHFLRARVPPMSVVPVGEGGHKAPVVVRKVDVERVRMISASCRP